MGIMNIALRIDCENAKAITLDGILSELAEKGAINIRRALEEESELGIQRCLN